MIIEGEECKFIEGTDEFYAVSVTGKVWSFYGRKHLKVVKLSKPKQKRPQFKTNGYLCTHIHYTGGVLKSKSIHRLVAETFIPNPDGLPQVNHKNEIKTDNRVENLEWCTAEYNVNYGNRSTKTSGANHYKYRFVCPIKLAYLKNIKKLTYIELANEFGVSKGCIQNAVKKLL